MAEFSESIPSAVLDFDSSTQNGKSKVMESLAVLLNETNWKENGAKLANEANEPTVCRVSREYGLNLAVSHDRIACSKQGANSWTMSWLSANTSHGSAWFAMRDVT